MTSNAIIVECPFCGNSDITFEAYEVPTEEIGSDGLDTYYDTGWKADSYCSKCSAAGPKSIQDSYKTEQAAIGAARSAWNQRVVLGISKRYAKAWKV